MRGANTQRESSISQVLLNRIEAGEFPSAVYLVAEKGRALFADALGDAVREPEQRPATLNTIYDLASLTKPLVTGLLCARRVESGELELDAAVGKYLPEFKRSDKSAITVRHLVTHTSGLAAWRPLYLLSESREGALAAIAGDELAYEPGKKVVYSDLGFITLGFLLQELSDMTLAEMAQREIFAPLELQRTFFQPTAAYRTEIAACESGNAYERDMCERDFPARPYSSWRNDLIWGEVHDGNAHFLGGAAGHAGLFSNAQDTLRLANQFLGEQSQLLSGQTCELFRQDMTPALNQARSFAWQLAATKDSTAGAALPPDAFGHTGFTGTSCWIDSARQRVFILLTNRTHNHPLPFVNINAVRREFHTLAVAALDQTNN